jgi:hypothetical protein
MLIWYPARFEYFACHCLIFDYRDRGVAVLLAVRVLADSAYLSSANSLLPTS